MKQLEKRLKLEYEEELKSVLRIALGSIEQRGPTVDLLSDSTNVEKQIIEFFKTWNTKPTLFHKKTTESTNIHEKILLFILIGIHATSSLGSKLIYLSKLGLNERVETTGVKS